VDGEFTMWENVAIARYVAEKYDAPSNWFGRGTQERAHINQFLRWYAYTLRFGGGAFHWNIFGCLIYGEKPYSERFRAAQNKGRTLLYEAMGVLENYCLRDREYACGDEISYADLVAFHEFVSHDAGKIIPDRVWQGFPKISAWFKKLSERPHAKTVSTWQYEGVAKIIAGERIPFKRRTAVLKGTEVFSGHNHGIPYLDEKVEEYIERVERGALPGAQHTATRRKAGENCVAGRGGPQHTFDCRGSGCSARIVSNWRRRFADHGLAA
jgi:glutathione S-transferase